LISLHQTIQNTGMIQVIMYHVQMVVIIEDDYWVGTGTFKLKFKCHSGVKYILELSI
jgi:hypothetical protein